MHMIGGTIGFYPPNAIQYRNPHDLMNDFKVFKMFIYSIK